MKTGSSVDGTIQKLQQILRQEAFDTGEQDVAKRSADTVRHQAARLQFPDPDVAAKVFEFLQRKAPTATRYSDAELYEALLAVMADSPETEELRPDKKKQKRALGPVRTWMRQVSNRVGGALGDLADIVVEGSRDMMLRLAMTFTPTVYDLEKKAAAIFHR